MKPETAHRVVMANLDWAVHFGLHRSLGAFPVEDPTQVMGIRFPNAVGLAAGMTPDGKAVSALGGLGFGFIEVGTVTPQPGVPTAEPRRFRLPSINGFIHRECGRSVDCRTMLANLKSADPFRLRGGIVGISLGHHPDTPSERILQDIQTGMEQVYRAADYLAICAHSLTEAADTEALIAGCAQQRDRLSTLTGKRLPLLAKVSPDSDNDTLKVLVHLLMQYGFDGVIATGSSEKILEEIHG
ncbi:dihydroorotate oxidase, partial [gut metagenome]